VEPREESLENPVGVAAKNPYAIVGNAARTGDDEAIDPSLKGPMVKSIEVHKHCVGKGEISVLNPPHLKDPQRACRELRAGARVDVHPGAREEVDEDPAVLATGRVDRCRTKFVEEAEFGDGPLAIFPRAEAIGGDPSRQDVATRPPSSATDSAHTPPSESPSPP
jgi:hypothetical protein